MLMRSVLTLAVAVIPSVWASAAAQLHLDTNLDTSECWISCHNEVTNTLPMPGTEQGYNSAAYIIQNCALDEYAQYMSECLPTLCISAPDVAYAFEYGKRWCEKGGQGIDLQLPTEYLASPAGAYFNSTQTSAASALSPLTIGTMLLSVGSGIAIIAL